MSVSTVNLSNSKSYIYMHLVSLSAKVSSFLAIIAMVFVFSGVEGKGQDPINCWPGYTKQTLTYFNPDGGCTYKVYYCYICFLQPDGSYVIRVNIGGYGLPDFDDCPLDQALIDLLKSKVRDEAIQLCQKPPCDGETKKLKVEISDAVCAKIVNVGYSLPGGGGTTYALYMIPCTNTICKKIYEVCWDYSHNPPLEMRTLIQTTVMPSPIPLVEMPGECILTDFPQIPPSGKTMNQSWETYCFTVNCN